MRCRSMKESGLFITTFTLFLAMASAALILAGCASSAGIAPKARTIDAAVLMPDAASAVSLGDTWWRAFDDERLNDAGLDITREHYTAQGALPPALAGSIKNSGSLLL